MAAQLMATNGFALRGLSEWMVRATNSLPVPLSPVMSTEAVLGATISIRRNTSCIRLEGPTSEPSTPMSRSLRRLASSSRSVPRKREAFCRILRRRVGFTGFSMKSKAPDLHRADCRVDAALRGEQDDCDLLRLRGDVLQQLHAIHARHAQVGNDDARVPALDRFQRFHPVAGGFGLIAPGTDQFGQSGPFVLLIFDD